MGIAADRCGRCVLVEDCYKPGLLITNAEFCGGIDTSAIVEVAPKNAGPVHFNNCSLWGAVQTVAIIDGKGSVSFNQCNIGNRNQKPTGPPTMDIRGGYIRIRDCQFTFDGPDIRIGEKVEKAIILGNLFSTSKEIENLGDCDLHEAFNDVVEAYTHK